MKRQLLDKVLAYINGPLPLQSLIDWFEDVSSHAYVDNSLRSVFAAVDAAFSAYYYDGIGESGLKQELAIAIRPFERMTSGVVVVISARPEPHRFATGTNVNLSGNDDEIASQIPVGSTVRRDLYREAVA